MTRSVLFVLALLLAIAACDPGEAERTAEPPPSEPSLRVSTVRMRRGAMDRQLALYGSIAPLSSSVRAYTLPFEVQVTRIHVTAGQHVAADEPLFAARRSPATAVAAAAAADLEKEARQRLEQVASRRADGLATSEEVIQAEGVLRRARQQLASMQRSGQLAGKLTVRSKKAGVVSFAGLQFGAQVPPGTTVVSIAEDASVGAQLWAAPDKARELTVGSQVTLEPLEATATKPASGHLLRIDERVDATTRQVRVSVGLDGPASMLLGQAVRGRVVVAAAEGFIVPRAALVAVDGAYRIFTVEDGRAHAHAISVVVESGDELLVRGDALHEQAEVVTLGAYQAEDGIRVETPP